MTTLIPAVTTTRLRPNPQIYHGPMRGADLPSEDGEPLESSWHLDIMYLLIRVLEYYWRDRTDVYLGGNMFIYFDPNQQKNRNFRGPDFFVVKGVTDQHPRHSWVIWEEEYRTPNVVIELASPSTIEFDLQGKKEIYEQILETPEYIVYDPESHKLQGWRLVAGQYLPIKPNRHGWLWLNELGLWLGVADYTYYKYRQPIKVLRFFDPQGHIIRTPEEEKFIEAIEAELFAESESAARHVAEERAERERQRADMEQKRAETEQKRAETEAEARRAAEAEVARLMALLKGQSSHDAPID